jgi:hypothetical protein
MPLFRKKADPISDRAKALSAEIALLETQIRELDEQLQSQPQPRLRSTALPSALAARGVEPAIRAVAAPEVSEPIFEQVDQDRLKARGETAVAPDHFNELGVRKYDLPALLRRIRDHFRGPSASNPKLVNYLAAGGIQGLRPLRYEKRVARNRFLFFVGLLFFILLGVILWAATH